MPSHGLALRDDHDAETCRRLAAGASLLQARRLLSLAAACEGGIGAKEPHQVTVGISRHYWLDPGSPILLARYALAGLDRGQTSNQ